ncbi:MAG: fatty acyl-AMP ligase [Hyphomicrobiales bacterium]
MTEPTKTEHQAVYPKNFRTLTDALDFSEQAETGMNFYAGRGELVETILYRDLAKEASEVGRKLLAKGLKPGDRVGLVAETEADFARAFMGCLYAHLVPCPLPLPIAFSASGAYAETLKRVLDVADASAIVVAPQYQKLLADHLQDYDFKFFQSVGELGDEMADLPSESPKDNDLAYIQFSSGTTSTPKGIAVSHQAMMANIDGMVSDALKLGSMDRGVNWLPFYHDMGLVGCMLLPIASHMSIDYLPTRDFIRRPALWVTLMSRNKATLTYAPTFGYDLAAKRKPKIDDLDLSNWRIAGLGGDMIKSDSIKAFIDSYEPHGFRKTNFLPSYGMAEMALGATFEKLDQGIHAERLDLTALEEGLASKTDESTPNSREFVSCGTILPNHQLEVRTSSGAIADERAVGTVFLKGPSVMQGYYGNEEETTRTLDQDGWLNTGDLGYLDSGNLTLTGRAKDLIIINGRNIWPQDIEWSIERSVNGAKEGRVVAFNGLPDASNEEEIICVVVEFRSKDEAERDSFRREVEAFIKSSFSVTPIVALSASGLLPRTSSGKLSRNKARAMFFDKAFD